MATWVVVGGLLAVAAVCGLLALVSWLEECAAAKRLMWTCRECGYPWNHRSALACASCSNRRRQGERPHRGGEA